MSKIDVVKSYWKSEGEKDLQKILSHFTETAEFTSPTMQLFGKDKIKIYYLGMINGFKEIEVTPTHWIESMDEIAVEYDCKLVRSSGEERFAKGFNIFKINNMKIENLRCYYNPDNF